MAKHPDNEPPWQYDELSELNFSAKSDFDTPSPPIEAISIQSDTFPTKREIRDYGTTLDDIGDAVALLLEIQPERPRDSLDSEPSYPHDSTVIFLGSSDSEYIELYPSSEGLAYYWSKVPEHAIERMANQKDVLNELGFTEIRDLGGNKTSEQIESLKETQFLVASDGMYVQFGRNRDAIVGYIVEIHSKVFAMENVCNLQITNRI